MTRTTQKVNFTTFELVRISAREIQTGALPERIFELMVRYGFASSVDGARDIISLIIDCGLEASADEIRAERNRSTPVGRMLIAETHLAQICEAIRKGASRQQLRAIAALCGEPAFCREG